MFPYAVEGGAVLEYRKNTRKSRGCIDSDNTGPYGRRRVAATSSSFTLRPEKDGAVTAKHIAWFNFKEGVSDDRIQ